VRIDLSTAQLEALGAAAAFDLSRPDDPFEHWQIELDTGITKAVTATARNLLRRGLIADDGKPRSDNGRIYASITDLGVQVLDELDSRGPNPDLQD
jgi:hypothetical protein